jgi:hypothetical protein
MHLGETLTVFLEMEGEALKNLVAVDASNPVAVGWMKATLDARKEIKKLLQECGVVFKIPESIEMGMLFDDPEIRKEYLALRAKALTKSSKQREGQGGNLYCIQSDQGSDSI